MAAIFDTDNFSKMNSDFQNKRPACSEIINYPPYQVSSCAEDLKDSSKTSSVALVLYENKAKFIVP